MAIRAAQCHDGEAAAALVYLSGPVAFEHIFNRAHGPDVQEFLAREFANSTTMFSYRHHFVYEHEGRVIATIGGFDKASHSSTFMGNAKAIYCHYGWRGIVKGLIFELRLVKAPRNGCFYLCHIAVAPEWRGKGIAAKLINYMVNRGQERGYVTLSLDVAELNVGAQRLYQQMGFSIVKRNKSYNGILDNHLYMEKAQ